MGSAPHATEQSGSVNSMTSTRADGMASLSHSACPRRLASPRLDRFVRRLCHSEQSGVPARRRAWSRLALPGPARPGLASPGVAWPGLTWRRLDRLTGSTGADAFTRNGRAFPRVCVGGVAGVVGVVAVGVASGVGAL